MFALGGCGGCGPTQEAEEPYEVREGRVPPEPEEAHLEFQAVPQGTHQPRMQLKYSSRGRNEALPPPALDP